MAAPALAARQELSIVAAYGLKLAEAGSSETLRGLTPQLSAAAAERQALKALRGLAALRAAGGDCCECGSGRGGGLAS